MSKRLVRDTGFYLRVFRAERDLSQTAAAKRFRVSPSHWSLMEAGARHPSPELAQALSDAIGVPIEVMLGLKHGGAA